MGAIFGKKKSTQESGNKAFDYIKSTFSPLTGYAGTGAEGISRLLSGDASGFNAFKDATGFNQLVQEGSRGITGNAAAGGLLRSGGTGKALVNYGNQMQNQYAGDYLNQLLGLSGIGMNAGQLISGAGQYSQGKSKEKPGLGGFIGQLSSGTAASDRRLKEAVILIGAEPDGLPVYSFRYKDDPAKKRHVGVMADEVAELRPWALGPLTDDGYATVNYDEIWSS